MIYYLLIYAVLLLFGASELGIGPDEAQIIFSHSWFSKLFFQLYSFAPDEVVVRAPVIVVSLANIALFYLLAKRYLKERDAFLSAVLFSLLPAVLGAGVIINKAPFIIFLTLIFLLFFSYEKFIYVYAFLLLIIDKAFAILFLSLALYYFYSKKIWQAWYYLLLFALSIYFYGFDVGGKPKSFFLDTFAVFSAIFSPLLFFYYFYTIYRIFIKEKKDLLWFVSATPFLFALLLSFRQKIYIIDFAPFAVIGTILMVKLFLHSYRVRLPRYRKSFQYALILVIGVLFVNDLVLLLHSRLFSLFPSSVHFFRNYYEGKLLAEKLKMRNISCIHTRAQLALQLQFYGIGECKDYILSKRKGTIPIILRKGGVFAIYYVTYRDNKR